MRLIQRPHAIDTIASFNRKAEVELANQPSLRPLNGQTNLPLAYPESQMRL
jgi:hypothetical protein